MNSAQTLAGTKKKIKKMPRESAQPLAKGRKDAMRLASLAARLLLLCIKLLAATHKTKQTSLPAEANRKEVAGRGLRGGARASGSCAALGQSRGHRARPRQSRAAPTCLALNVLGIPRGRLGCV